MKTHRILGGLWMALGGISGILIMLELLHKASLSGMLSTPFFWLATSICLLYLAGAVTGVFLFCSKPWARGFVGVIAVLIVMATIALSVVQWSLPILCGVIGIFAIVSVVLLFFPSKPIVVGTVVLLALGTATWIALQLDIPHRLALAEGRRAIASHRAEPLDLTAQYTTLWPLIWVHLDTVLNIVGVTVPHR